MQFASFAEETVLFGATAVENEFIMEYMLQAPGDFVRVYLYMLFQCQYPQAGNSLSDATRMLGISEEDFLRAMRYWERQGLWRRVADNPPAFSLWAAGRRLWTMCRAKIGNCTPSCKAFWARNT